MIENVSFHNNIIVIPKTKNSMMIEKIILPNIEGIENVIVQLNIDNKLVWKYSMKFFLHFNNYTIENNNKVIILPDFLKVTFFPNQMNNTLSVISFCSYECSLAINYDDVAESRQLDQRCKMQIEHHCLTQVEQHCKTQIYNIDSNNIKLLLTNDFQCIKGYFIECDMNSIENLSITLNDQYYIDYDEVMIYMFCKKISDSLFYCPINVHEKYDNINIKSFHGSFNNNKIDNTHLLIQFKDDYLLNKITIYPLTFGIWTYNNGDCVNDINEYYHWSTKIKFNTLDESIIKPLNNKQCIITHDDIDVNDIYTSCFHCHNIYSINALSNWLRYDNSCPMCRKPWNNVVKYKNTCL